MLVMNQVHVWRWNCIVRIVLCGTVGYSIWWRCMPVVSVSRASEGMLICVDYL